MVAEIEAGKRAIRDVLALAKLREHRGQTQQDVANESAVSQGRISRIEHQQDIYLSTLQSYIEALGGHLEIVAVFPDERILLVDSGEDDPAHAVA